MIMKVVAPKHTNELKIRQHNNEYMTKHEIEIPDEWKHGGNIYHIPKMRKTPPKQRYIALYIKHIRTTNSK